MGYIGQEPTAVPLVAGDITDGIISEAKLAADAVSLAKMKAGTDGNIISYDASGNPVAIATGSDGQVLTSAGAGAPPLFEALPAGGYTDAGVATTTSGASTVISGIGAGAQHLMIVLNKVSTGGASQIQVQLGDAGGLENSGYAGTNHRADGTSLTTINGTSYFIVANGGGAADPFCSVIHLHRSATGVQDWICTWLTKQSTAANNFGSGSKTLSGDLTQVALLTNGTFDAGGFNVFYQ